MRGEAGEATRLVPDLSTVGWACGGFRPLPSDHPKCRDQTKRGTARASSAAGRGGSSFRYR